MVLFTILRAPRDAAYCSLERANLLYMIKMIKTIKNNDKNDNTINRDTYNQNDDTYSVVSL